MYFSLLIYFNNYSLHVSNRLTIHHQAAVAVHAAYGIYHVQNILKLCKITYIYILHIHTYVHTLSLKRKTLLVYKVSEHIKRFF